MSEEEWIYYSYRDKNGEVQHAKIKRENAGEFIGDLLTYYHNSRRLVDEMLEIVTELNPQP